MHSRKSTVNTQELEDFLRLARKLCTETQNCRTEAATRSSFAGSRKQTGTKAFALYAKRVENGDGWLSPIDMEKVAGCTSSYGTERIPLNGDCD